MTDAIFHGRGRGVLGGFGRLKEMLDEAFIQQFQSNSKKAVQRLISEGKLQRDPQSVSALLRSPELDLAAVGDYLGDG